MIKLLVSMFLALSVFSASASTSALKQSIDELNYALSVEWDQNDEAFLKASIETFKADLAKQGVSHDELLSIVAKNNNLSEEELLNVIRSASYQKGASWNGLVYVLGGIGLGVGIFFTIVLLDSMDVTTGSIK
jgi:radical SAM superfamily enzyme with C-terminal helix-hairpin-helix motif